MPINFYTYFFSVITIIAILLLVGVVAMRLYYRQGSLGIDKIFWRKKKA
jgi:hypothetical protein